MRRLHVAYRYATGCTVRWGRGLVLVTVLWAFGPFDAGLQAPPKVGAQATTGASLQVSDTVMNGWRWFHVYCFRCHGIDALGSQLAPNLRDSIQKLSHEEFTKIVRDGKPNTAMQPWNALLDTTQIEDVYQYVLARSEGRLGRGRPDEQ
jgi:mono/diheme cytochrome c family protein